MRLALNGLIRLTIATGLALFTLAAALGHLGHRDCSWPSEADRRLPAGDLAFVTTPGEPIARFLDVASGSEVHLDLEPCERLDVVACSPWADAQRRRLVAGRWTFTSSQGKDGLNQAVGLALYRVPDGARLAKVETELWPVAPPCYYPDSAARVLYPTGDGQLHQFDFRRTTAQEETAEAAPGPVPVGWDWTTRWHYQPLVTEPCWPAIPGFERTLLVSLNERGEDGGPYGPTEIWWLRLDQAGDNVIDAGRLTCPIGYPDEPQVDEHRPVLGRGPDGELLLLYQARRAHQLDWELRIAPVQLDDATGVPSAGDSQSIDHDKRVSNHTLAADGHSVYSILREWGKPTVVRKVPLAGRWLAQRDLLGTCLNEAHSPL
jgi:hypothetical protein